jgi:hypothetical protein
LRDTISLKKAALDKTKLKDSFEKHAAEPNVSMREYVRDKKIELGKRVSQHKLIYLDMNYWIILRDVLLGRRTDAESLSLLSNLRLHMRKDKIICPISSSVIMEMLKQQDIETRRKSAELIDELSFGVTLVCEEERIGTELAHFIYSQSESNSNYPLNWLIWSKLSFIFGDMYPTNTGLSPEEELVIQKSFFDYMWDHSLTEIIENLRDEQAPMPDFKGLASRLNEGNVKHSNEIQSFKQVYKNEIEGGFRLFMPVVLKILEEKYERLTGVMPKISDDEKKEHEEHLLRLFVQVFRDTKIVKLSPTLHINALCHASVRWDIQRKLKGNDLYDFYHAMAAVPYCDVFFVEKPLRAMLEQKNLQINKDFDCKIISSVSEAVEFLEKE